ncbi:hypothetical protein VOLCADRAFT_95892 [Volvox carteri f. nagariensis]|uniref:Anamorsin homolog n=1 Tax=Volvox carteri f. nagariensis TaxID=3068 RepID=D8U8M9_VOLCA|nr:uncharacterized protein VOLCADRAFT_95892 [Volvox carteri f. nagariensis]EFJ43949.1 hypothetical protein VOLCADRAFT_95892 [Volvox carteri f. nagariensis]|eukprot:XP_002954961.1 hypothetical protein VOLCADRAFT_95892 [Volvox carteri f. nagariensis]
MTSAACFISNGVAPGAALQALLEKETLSLSSINLVCCEQQPAGQIQQSGSKYNVVLAASSSPHSRDVLVRVAREMAPGGRLYVYEATHPGSNAPGAIDTGRLEALKHDLLLSGFTDTQVLDATGLSSSAANVPAVWVFSQLPSWGLGASAKLSLKRPAAAAAAAAVAVASAAPAATVPPSSVWKLGGDEEDGMDELVDEDELLTVEDRKAASAPKPDDCEVGQSGRKACKNCSCGRAEAEAAGGGGGVKLTADMLDNPQSACGNCYLGDAFRCASCPYRGLPAFQPGEKVTLGTNMLAADV